MGKRLVNISRVFNFLQITHQKNTQNLIKRMKKLKKEKKKR
jgi:hypothetical protein